MKHAQGTVLHNQGTGKMEMLNILPSPPFHLPSLCPVHSYHLSLSPSMDQVKRPHPTNPAQGHQKLDRSSAAIEVGTSQSFFLEGEEGVRLSLKADLHRYCPG